MHESVLLVIATNTIVARRLNKCSQFFETQKITVESDRWNLAETKSHFTGTLKNPGQH